MQLPDGSVLSVGTVSCDDQIHQAVYLSFALADSDIPIVELGLPPKTVDAIIRQLQEYANQVRYVNGVPMLEYPEPHPERPRGTSRRSSKDKRSKTKKGPKGAAPGGTEGPPSVS